MTSPRVEVDLGKIRHNTKTLVRRLKVHGIDVAGVTKAVCGHPEIAQAMLDGGATGLADSRIANIRRMRRAGITCAITLIRSPLLSQIDDVVQYCDASYNSESEVIAALGDVAEKSGTAHNILLMVEMGDMREGILPGNVASMAQHCVKTKGIVLSGLATNFACFGGQRPDAEKMAAFSTIAEAIENQYGPFSGVVSGGNSASLPWAVTAIKSGRIDDLRIGEAILLGVDPLNGEQIGGLFTDAFSLVAEVIETKVKSETIVAAIGTPPSPSIRLVTDNDCCSRSILALGHQDTDVLGLTMPPGTTYLGATSDHMVVQRPKPEIAVGSELSFQMNYSALMRIMASPDITIKLTKPPAQKVKRTSKSKTPHLDLV